MRMTCIILALTLATGMNAQTDVQPQPVTPITPPPSELALHKFSGVVPPTRASLLYGNTHPDAVAVFDVTGNTNNLNKTLFFPSPSAAVQQQINSLKDKMTETEANAVLDALKREIDETSDRWISTKGDTVHIYVLYSPLGAAPDISVKEEDRDTRLATDLATLIKIVKNVAFSTEPLVLVADRPYQLTKVRATLKISATQKAGATPPAAEKSITTGPTEHLFLSADIPITKVKELKYDDTAKTFTTKDSPSLYHVGLDYTLGDIFTTDQTRPWEGIVCKLLLKISRRPLDSYGAAIGYRSPNFNFLGFNLQSFTPFVGYFRTKVSDKDAAGKPITAQKTGIRVGISLNLDKALDWTKKKS